MPCTESASTTAFITAGGTPIEPTSPTPWTYPDSVDRCVVCFFVQVESVVQKRVLRYFRRQGLLDELDAAGMLTWQGSGG